MHYKMYEEMMEQPRSLKDTLKMEKSHMEQISEKFKEFDKIYLVGCGSSLSTCFSAIDAMKMVSNRNLEVFTGYEFFYHKKLDEKNTGVILTSQSGETADTLAALRKAQDKGMCTVSIVNEMESTMMNEADDAVLTRCERETAILGTKTYMTQLMSLYQILFRLEDSPDAQNVINDLGKIPSLTEDLLKKTEHENKVLAKNYADYDIFYAMGSGPNYGLAYKLAMTMFMEGALKHSCPLYSGEFRHGLIERVEKNIPVVFLDAGYPGDELTNKSIEFSNKIGAKNIVYRMQDYAKVNPLLSPFILVVPLEWLIYYLAHYNGEDPGSTRHIGKVRY
ncbi:SIS domain-containing protein [Methanobacterium petrolearium]|uniref:SIS domain-containing protein n=1 Tax=Methanobacterium petrolearium TaxID=710190 RepID=UPI001AE11A88|nr:SIS domain-containing protein [Methanobacterium petrolearium]MBP1945119.1 glucosamine--fructose-6-phosphate aminotransferase (isomerizing) [Methanobacterium petrolearium]BDZ71044.1 glucosamine--fructose-6-phosphate aminotransferase [Methanobacterium petrolearium]